MAKGIWTRNTFDWPDGGLTLGKAAAFVPIMPDFAPPFARQSPQPPLSPADRARDLWASLNDWWALAGADVPTADATFPWLQPAPSPRPSSRESARAGREPEASRPGAAPQPKPAPRPAVRLPQADTIDAFVAWWMGPDAPPGNVPVRARVAPSGNPRADLFILTDMPEADDLAGGLFTGALRPMMDRMLAALTTSRADVWMASLIAARPGSGQIVDTDLPELGKIARLHIGLVRPKRLWVLGQSAKRALLGVGGPPDGGLTLDVNHNGDTIVGVHTRHPRLLAENPKYKREAWAAMQALLAV